MKRLNTITTFTSTKQRVQIGEGMLFSAGNAAESEYQICQYLLESSCFAHQIVFPN